MRIAPVVKKVQMKKAEDGSNDLNYWLQQSVSKRAAAVTFIISQSLKPGERMNKTVVTKRKLKE